MGFIRDNIKIIANLVVVYTWTITGSRMKILFSQRGYIWFHYVNITILEISSP